MTQLIKFYVDEHIANAVVRGLRLRGIDAITVAEAGMRGRTDEQQLSYALAKGHIFFTFDDDFLRLHAAGVKQAGIVYAPETRSIGEIIRRPTRIYQSYEPEDMRGKVEYI